MIPEAPGAAPAGRWRALRPLGHRDFRLLFAAVVLSVFAAGMWAVVMVFAVIAAGGGPVELSIVAAANAVGLLACAIPGGIVADRVSRRFIVRGVESINLVAIGSIVVVGMFTTVPVWQLTVVALLLGAGAGFFFPAYSAIVPRLLPPSHLLAANGLEAAIRPLLQQAVGPAAGGLLLAALIPSHAAAAIAAAHAGALVLLMLVGPEPAAGPAADSAPAVGGHGGGAGDDGAAEPTGNGVLQDLREAVVFTLRTPWLLWTLLFATGWVLVALGPQEVLLPFITRERIGEDPRWFGFLLASFGVGGVAGSLLVSSRRLPRRYLTVMMVVWGVSALPFAVLGVTDQYWLMVVSCFVSGFGFSYGQVIWGTLLQRRVPRHMLGRVSSLDFFVSLALMPVSMALAGPLAVVVPIPVIFFAAALLPGVFGMIAYIVARMPRDEIDHPLAD